MPIERKVQQICNSLHVTLPRQVCDAVGIKRGTLMKIEYRNGKIIMTPPASNRQDLQVDGGDNTPIGCEPT